MGVIERVGRTNQPLCWLFNVDLTLELTSPSFTPTVLHFHSCSNHIKSHLHSSILTAIHAAQVSLYNCKLAKKVFFAHYF